MDPNLSAHRKDSGRSLALPSPQYSMRSSEISVTRASFCTADTKTKMVVGYMFLPSLLPSRRHALYFMYMGPVYSETHMTSSGMSCASLTISSCMSWSIERMLRPWESCASGGFNPSTA